MPRPTEPGKRVFYVFVIIVWASGVQLPVLDYRINDYLEEITAFCEENLLLLSAPKSTVTLFTLDTKTCQDSPEDCYWRHIPASCSKPKDTRSSSGLHPSIPRALQLCSRQSTQANVTSLGHLWNHLGSTKGDATDDCKAIGRLIINYGAPVWSIIKTTGSLPREMKHTLCTRQSHCVKDTLKSIHTTAPFCSITNNEANLPRQRTTLSKLRSGQCKLLGQYKKRIGKDVTECCPDCGVSPQDVLHLFNCPPHPTRLKPPGLWGNPGDTIREFSHLNARNLEWWPIN